MVDNIRIRVSFSDHNIVVCDTIVSILTKEWRETYYDLKKANYSGMKIFLEKYDWKRTFQDAEVGTQFHTFKYVYNSAVRKCDALSTRKRKPRWMTKRAELAREKSRYRDIGECHLYEAYDRQLNRTRNEVEKAKRNFEEKLAGNI